MRREPPPADEERAGGGAGPDLGELGALLASGRVRPGCMGLAELDGFLASLAAGPGRVPDPAAWMPLVWGEGQPAFADAGEARRVVFAVMDRLHEVWRQLREGPGAYRPVLRTLGDGAEDAAGWARGFWAGVALRPRAWDPLLGSAEGRRLLVPIVAQLPDWDGEIGAAPGGEGLDGFRRLARALIPGTVADLCRFWREREPGGATAAPAPAGGEARRSGRRASGGPPRASVPHG